MEATSQDSRGPGQNKRVWTENEDAKLIEALLEVHAMGKFNADGGFKSGFFPAVESRLSVTLPESGIKADPHIRSRVKTLKGHFGIVHDLLTGPNTSGFGYDDTTKCVVAERPVWDAYLQSHKKAAMFKDKPFPYYRELCTIFSKDRANGRYAESAADAVEDLESHPQPTNMEEMDLDVLGDGIEAMDFTTSNEGFNTEGASDAGSSRKKRKKKGMGVVDQTIVEIAQNSTAAMTASMEKNASLISKALQDGEVQEMRKNLNSELASIAGLTMAERHRALIKIASDRAITTVFFTLQDAEKEVWVRSFLG